MNTLATPLFTPDSPLTPARSQKLLGTLDNLIDQFDKASTADLDQPHNLLKLTRLSRMVDNLLKMLTPKPPPTARSRSSTDNPIEKSTEKERPAQAQDVSAAQAPVRAQSPSPSKPVAKEKSAEQSNPLLNQPEFSPEELDLIRPLPKKDKFRQEIREALQRRFSHVTQPMIDAHYRYYLRGVIQDPEHAEEALELIQRACLIGREFTWDWYHRNRQPKVTLYQSPEEKQLKRAG